MRTPLALPGWRHVYSGKVRELYVPEVTGSGDPAGEHVLVVATDRISAYDRVLDTPIPDKGRILTALSLWWFGRLAELHWGVPDPAAVEGTEAEKRLAFADTYRMLKNRISVFVSLPITSLDRLALQKRLSDIGQS